MVVMVWGLVAACVVMVAGATVRGRWSICLMNCGRPLMTVRVIAKGDFTRFFVV